jgi:hypothetical protein
VTLQRRTISVTFTLGKGSFGTDGSNNVTLDGLRVSAKISKAGGYGMSTLNMRVFGMTESVMNQLSTLGMVMSLYRRNFVLVQAGSEGSVPGTVFVGTISNAWADFQAQPEVAFNVEAHEGLLEALTPSAARSYSGPTDVAVILSGIAAEMHVPFENNGVSVILNTPYYSGSLRNQAWTAAKDANIGITLDNNVLAIWNKGQPRGMTAPLISPSTGMVGYPAYTSRGIAVKTVFNPAIGFGGKIMVESAQKPASGLWVVYSLGHDLEANMPHGQWFSSIEAARPAVAAGLIAGGA